MNQQDQAPRPRGRQGGRKPAMTPEQIAEARVLWDLREVSLTDLAQRFGVARSTMHRHVTREDKS